MPFKKFIPISKPSREFEEHLAISGNSRIILSGIFGSGKTTFLREFFKANADEYVAFHLFPTNYVSTANEDIFQLIKYDILYCLLELSPTFEVNTVSKQEALPFFLQEIGQKELDDLLLAIPKIGKPVARILKPLTRLWKGLGEKAKELSHSEPKEIEKFAESIEAEGRYDSDQISLLITNLVARIKADKEPVKKSALIVDDLDRIDPENIFRILNVFSVHLDLSGGSADNKFNFDKVIFCCDVENLRRIFHNRFGMDINFNGYVDKFYAKSIFYFENKKEIKGTIADVLFSIRLKQGLLWNSKEVQIQETMTFNYASYIVSSMIDSDALTLRQLEKLSDYEYNDRNFIIQRTNGEMLENHQLFVAPFLDFLIHIFWNERNLIAAIRSTRFAVPKSGFLERLLGDLMLAIDLEQVDLSRKEQNFSMDKAYGFEVMSGMSRHSYGTIYWGATNSNVLTKIPLNNLLIKAIEVYASLRTVK